ncbi:ferredoxin [Desulfarculus baarsii DSM 2075]|uniref:Ferredoxin n=1 Tax=Desulfarculus baarsii (strain ATCC 33931 / DSM 2075 / LMG 7858 / VKM B-1802 / 2st14) TaxID=644282 RepID=E1QF22_DESB2|nr:2Fe-2S iron-sulfur cluster-binding protein [Desulfarculus baarsii]ADK84158.1 ferredoxin [Desulfarculus baarsii DSM 2075]
MIKFTINDQVVEAQPGWTVLETARHYGLHIPTLCYHEAVSPSGACRLCVVELRDGDWSKVVISCMYPVAEGINIYTDSPKVQNVRRWILEMLLAQCPAAKEVRDLAAQYGVTKTRFKINDPNEDCMLCGLCVRVCEEVVGAKAISTVGRGAHKQVAPPYMQPTDDCVACGSCLTICPTGAMARRFDMLRGKPKVILGAGSK